MKSGFVQPSLQAFSGFDAVHAKKELSSRHVAQCQTAALSLSVAEGLQQNGQQRLLDLPSLRFRKCWGTIFKLSMCLSSFHADLAFNASRPYLRMRKA